MLRLTSLACLALPVAAGKRKLADLALQLLTRTHLTLDPLIRCLGPLRSTADCLFISVDFRADPRMNWMLRRLSADPPASDSRLVSGSSRSSS